ncbi:hypothetical protein D9615_006750 [Tricholomella constricta]|uniref:DUF6534 domain-containing protein n=1 Tax=Tricholomella constricta TaxID=117010 RepID=A0A8H5H753_9AGAR|nr:hypothetical protein D9615_006750 [Tricholomella constricta]
MAPSLHSTLGAASVGLSVSCIVFGILTTQVFLYFRRYPADRPFYKIIVGAILCLEIIDQILVIHCVYHYTVTNFGNYVVLVEGEIVWSLLLEVALGAIVGIIVKAVYAMRVWRFSNKNIYVTGTIGIMILAQFGLAILYVVKSFQMNKFSFAAKLKSFAALGLSFGVLTDVATAAALSFFMRRMRTGFKTSDSLINMLTVYAINTGFLTSAFSLTVLLLFYLRPTDFYFMTFYFILAKLYAISFLCTLNTRKVFSYFWRYPQDRPHFKITVLAILLLETADQTFIGHLVYHYSITNFAKPQSLLNATVTWSLILQLTVGAIVGAIVKASFGLRVWRFSERNYYITGVIMFLTFGQLALAIAFTVKAFELPSVFSVHELQTLGTISLTAGVITDIVTAVALCFFLNRLRTGFHSSDSLVNSLCRYAINTGALTSAVSLTTLILYNLHSKDNLYFVATYFILSKLYAISYMATLNTRRTIRGRGTDRQGGTTNKQDTSTNMFHLGTRLPSMGPNELGGWDSGKNGFAEQDFPLNTFAQSGKPNTFV